MESWRAVGFSVWISRGTRIPNFDFIRRRLLLLFRGICVHGLGFCRFSLCNMPDLWSTSSWSSKPIAQVSFFIRHKNPITNHISFKGCSISRSTSSRKVCIQSQPAFPQTHLSFQSPLKAFYPSSNGHSIRGQYIERKLHGSPHRLMSSFVQDRTSTPSARPRSTQRGLFASCW